MRILVVGSGGREHAICSAFANSAKVSHIFCADGNAGISRIADCVPIEPSEISKLADFASENNIDLTFVGGETPLSLGIVDEFEKRGLRIIGASRQAAQLESSKSFAKDFMARHGIPTARYKTVFSVAEAIGVLESGEFGEEQTPVVVKADGLAAGKGVVVAANRSDAIDAVNDLEKTVGKEAVEKIVLEECLFGREVSLLMFCDGESYALMPPTRDHKRIGEGDTGPNTGGMGAITGSELLTDEQIRQIVSEIIEPTLKGCTDEEFPFRGILFLGLMLTDVSVPGAVATGEFLPQSETAPVATAPGTDKGAAKVLEYNVRFGDPEAQSIIVRLETDLVDICEAIESRSLNTLDFSWKPGNSACIVLASKGYPQQPQTCDVIYGLEKIDDQNVAVFHAATAFDLSEPGEVATGFLQGQNASVERAEKNPPAHAGGSEYITAGGRVLGVTATADDLQTALDVAYAAVEKISWNGMQYRRDIGKGNDD